MIEIKDEKPVLTEKPIVWQRERKIVLCTLRRSRKGLLYLYGVTLASLSAL